MGATLAFGKAERQGHSHFNQVPFNFILPEGNREEDAFGGVEETEAVLASPLLPLSFSARGTSF